MLSPSRFTYSVFVCTSIVLYLTTYYTWCCIYVNLLSPWVRSCWQWAATLRGFRTSLSLITWYRWSPSVLGEWLLICIYLITMIVHVVTDGSSPIVFNRLFTMSFLMFAASKIRLRPFSEQVGSFFVSIWKNMHFFIAVSILFWGLFMSGIPRTFIIKIASNKIPVVYPVMQDFQQIRYSFSV